MPKKDRAAAASARPPAPATHYQVLARRWRPQQFSDLVGQEAIGQALAGAITAGRVAHAYLFTGHRGVGKTSTARILAKALNCREGPTPQPCGQCDACEGIASGDDVDVLEIDGASNRGIDEVRELRQNAHLRPTRARYKIYIIDEVHMLTREAFNALLKTLEEPPQHVKFIFATTDPQKVPVTILSRCQRFDFRGIGDEQIQQQLRKIVDAEGARVDEGVIELLTRRAGGSMRDAQSLLDQLLAFGEDRITADRVHGLLGTADDDRLIELVEGLLDHNAGAAIAAVDRAESEGVQIGELLDQLIEHFRDLMVAQAAGPNARLLALSARQRAHVADRAARVPLDTIFAAADILAETKARLRACDHARALVDVALVRIASLESLAPLGELAERLAALEAAAPNGGERPTPTASPAAAGSKKNSTSADDRAPARVQGPARAVGDAPAAASATGGDAPPAGTAAPVSLPAVLTADSAAQLLRRVSSDLNPVWGESIARARLSVGPAPNMLVLCLDGMYNTAGRIKEIETALQQRVGDGIRIRVELSSLAGDANSAERRSSYSERLNEATRDPLVQGAMDLFGARVVRVEEP